jgi:hypothetical protein
MSLLFADLNGLPVIKARLVVPFTGIWHADIGLDRAVDLSGPQTFQLAGSAWVGTAIRAIDFSGVRGVRLVGGSAGWRKKVPYRQYAIPGGVPFATITSDLAILVNEIPPVLSPSLPPTVGPAYVRRAGLASLVLQDLFEDIWWLDPLGVVQTKARLPTPITSEFTAIAVSTWSGIYSIATEFPADWAPGATFAGLTVSGTISRVTHVLEAGTLRSEVMAA